MSSWEKHVRKYVWNEQKTPFLVPVNRLNKGQAQSEIFLFVVFLATPYTLILLGSLAYVVRGGAYQYLALALYALSVLVAAVVLNASKQWRAAAYCLTAPLVILLYFLVAGFGDRMQTLDQALMLTMLVAWLLYTARVVSIARAYAGLPDPPRPPVSYP